jgi:hypothetical protein
MSDAPRPGLDPESGALLCDSGLLVTASSRFPPNWREPAKVEISGRAFLITFYPGGSLGLVIDDPSFGTSWDDADEDGRRQAHHEWLERQLGPPHRADAFGNRFWNYRWGEVRSILHPKDGSSSILIQYDERPRRSLLSLWRRMGEAAYRLLGVAAD